MKARLDAIAQKAASPQKAVRAPTSFFANMENKITGTPCSVLLARCSLLLAAIQLYLNLLLAPCADREQQRAELGAAAGGRSNQRGGSKGSVNGMSVQSMSPGPSRDGSPFGGSRGP